MGAASVRNVRKTFLEKGKRDQDQLSSQDQSRLIRYRAPTNVAWKINFAV